ncbi:16S rRNA (cytosine(967)-C(5))-methyltransferase RsmB [Alteromonas sediminis]|uniref:16S rRNA (cytosine(967)-C(5))-methyltransferase n=1 Tax=Alteromonas sediminis TaxID=2259342 RepID=A0A3N5Y295_9ALTE|nr:16S rRNA (cytosine(967)-C(5))-methyltransferase RsmB [Alteromonas sediminis]RPJ66796.1 16S rRNA (cytosine(967)-C(5))-methyltransferase RsmB [Alteromonas sediminis]
MNLIPPKGYNLRADSAWVIFQVLEQGVSARECLPKVLEKYVEPRDRNWLNEVTMGVFRTLPLLQSWLRPMLAKPLKGDKKIIEHLLLIGFYQLAFMRVSEHAATNETVNAAGVLKAKSLSGLVNGILRQFQRQEHPPAKSEAMKAGLPGWIYKKLAEAYPQKLSSIIDAMNAKPPIWLRVNTQKTTITSFTQVLTEAGVSFTTSDLHPDGVIIGKGDITQLPGFEQGEFTVQDGAAQLAAEYLSPQSGDHILDCCAAPGGKTTHLYAHAPDSSIVALELEPARIARINENMSRLGARAQVVQGDASQPHTWWDGKYFDRILLDAPCSATGIIRRHPDIRWLRKVTDIAPLVSLQASILDAIWPLLKPGGTLLYATCSILPEENQEQIDRFLARTPDATAEGVMQQILPGEAQMDGFYYARLLKS